MHRHTRLLLTTLIAATALAAAISSASANRLSVSNRNIRVVSTSLEFSNNVNSNVVRCSVTAEGSFTEGTIRKVLGALVGVVTRVAVNNGGCTGGHATVHEETLPWRTTYEGFTGRLPRIESIIGLLIGASYEIETGGSICTGVTEEAHPAQGITDLGAAGEITNSEAESGKRIPLRNGRGGFLCSLGEGSFSGRGTATVQGNTSRIIVTLI